MLNAFYISVLNDWVAKDLAANPIFKEHEVQSVIAKGLKFETWAEVLAADVRDFESRLEGFSSSMVRAELRKLLDAKRNKRR